MNLLYNYSMVLLFQEPAHEKATLLTVNPGLIIWTIIIFVLLLLLLRKIAWKPLLNSLNTRETSIRSAIESAEKLKDEAQQMIEENRKNLAEANAQSMKIIAEAREIAAKEKDSIVDKAREEVKKLNDQAMKEIQQEKDTALSELRSTVSELAVKAAELIIKQNLDENKQKQIIDQYLDQVPSKN